jgi:hypothetical protein
MVPVRRFSSRLVSVGLLATVLLLGAIVVLQTQVRVGAGDPDGRACGSALDALTGRSGWERWWSADLDELPAGQASSLTRTELCPRAINNYLWVSSLLVAGGLSALGLVAWERARARGRGGSLSIRRLGTAIVTTGVLLTVGGAVALVVLVADPSSTLFIYVDRLVVALIGLIVLVPALALIGIGRAIMLVGERIPEETRRR